jgi:hypothetical protein
MPHAAQSVNRRKWREQHEQRAACPPGNDRKDAAPAPEPRHHPTGHRRDHGTGEIGHKNQAEQRRGEMIGRPGEMKTYVREHSDKIEQHAEADAVSGEQLRIL